MSGDHNTGWRKRQIALDIKAKNARELGLNYEPNKTIIEMARQAGMVYREFEDEFANANTDGVDKETLERFAELVRADEREAIAQMFEGAPALVQFAQNDQGGCLICGFTPKLVIEVMRARGNT